MIKYCSLFLIMLKIFLLPLIFFHYIPAASAEQYHKTIIPYENKEREHLILKLEKSVITFTPSKKLIVVLLGAPGSGKSTHGIKLSKLLGIPHISVGDLIRQEILNQTKMGWVIKIYDQHFSDGLPDDILVGVLIRRIKREDCKYGFILDGFPKTETQVSILKNVLLRTEDIHIPIFLSLSKENIKSRLQKRYICPSCGVQVREFDNNPWPGYCPIDAKKGKMVLLINRSDDTNKKVLERRLKLFWKNKNMIISSLKKRAAVIIIKQNNDFTQDEIFEHLKEKIIERFNK